MRPSSRDFEMHLALAAIHDSRFREYVCDQIPSNFFTEFDCQYVYEVVLRLRKKRKHITFFTIYETIRRDTVLSDEKATKICDILLPYIKPDSDLTPIVSMLDGVLPITEEIVKNRIVEMATTKTIDLYEEGKIDEVIELWDKVGRHALYTVPSKVSVWDELSKGISIKEMLNYRLGIPTGIRGMDDAHSMAYLDHSFFFKGIGRGHLFIALADSNVGKSTFMLNIALYQSLRGYNVSYYSLEMDKEYLLARSISILTGIPTDDIIKDINSKRLHKKIDEIYERYPDRGSFDITHHRQDTLSFSVLGHDLTLNAKEGKPTDSLIMDYLDLMASDRRYKEKRFEIGDNAVRLRDLGNEYDCAVFSPSKANRGTFRDKKKPKDRSNMGEDYSKVYTCDQLVVLNESVEETNPIGKGPKQQEMVRCFVDKNRFGRRGMTLVLHPDKDTARFFDVLPAV